MSRRLNHFSTTCMLLVKSNSPLVERTLYETISQAINIDNKYRLKGHTLESCIKKIDSQIDIKETSERGMFVSVSINIHHYSRLSFDQRYYASVVNDKLGLPPASVTVIEGEFLFHKPERSKTNPSPKGAFI